MSVNNATIVLMGFNIEFSIWMKEERIKLHLSQTELAKKAGVTPNAIYGIENQLRRPGPDLCNGLARAFNLPASVVFIRAGLMEPEKKRSILDQEIAHKATFLTKEQKEIVLAAIDGIIAHNET